MVCYSQSVTKWMISGVKKMTEARKALKIMIFEKYDTETACAEAIGWPKQRLNKMTSGKKEPSVSEVFAIANAVERPVAEVAGVFLQMKSPNG